MKSQINYLGLDQVILVKCLKKEKKSNCLTQNTKLEARVKKVGSLEECGSRWVSRLSVEYTL
jgi:hypothetical protein